MLIVSRVRINTLCTGNSCNKTLYFVRERGEEEVEGEEGEGGGESWRAQKEAQQPARAESDTH